jgi:hypothetical protein
MHSQEQLEKRVAQLEAECKRLPFPKMHKA